MADPAAEVVDPLSAELTESSQPFVGRWNRLVSTTNWEKGRIISQWRDALKDDDAPAADYSDEAWARLVGGVTGQHVGRLRRVYQRFGTAYEQYEGLYWSHFQAALDWDDAEMWLEGGLQNGWSVSQMRKARWETLGAVAKDQPRDEDVVTSDLDEDFEPASEAPPDTDPATIRGTVEAVQASGDEPAASTKSTGSRTQSDKPAGKGKQQGEPGASIYTDQKPAVAFVRPFENLAELPDDLADAFESFKLAILHHKAASWEEISREDVLGSLEALKELALAPSADAAPF